MAIKTFDDDPIQAFVKVQTHLIVLNTQFHEEKIFNFSKLSKVTSFTLHAIKFPLTYINNALIPNILV